MSSLNTAAKLNSESRFGFRLFLTTAGLMILSTITITLLSVSGIELTDKLFGFYFPSLAQKVTVIVFTTFISAAVAAVFMRKHILAAVADVSKVIKTSTIWFSLVNVAFWAVLFFGDQTPHYGVTGREELVTEVPLSILSIVIFYVVASFLLKRKVAN
jgi:glutamine amidotransferase PdxT